MDSCTGPRVGDTCPSEGVRPQEILGRLVAGSCPVGNPINLSTGNKFQRALDYRGVGPLPLVWERFYNSASVNEPWCFSYSRRVEPTAVTGEVEVVRDDAKVFVFADQGGGVFTGQPDEHKRKPEHDQGPYQGACPCRSPGAACCRPGHVVRPRLTLAKRKGERPLPGAPEAPKCFFTTAVSAADAEAFQGR